jgi:hypothetical protein
MKAPLILIKLSLQLLMVKLTKICQATANKTAIAIKPINNNILILCDIFFELMAAKNLNKKYKATKINTV